MTKYFNIVRISLIAIVSVSVTVNVILNAGVSANAKLREMKAVMKEVSVAPGMSVKINDPS